MADYELYWNPDLKKAPTNMVVSGSFGSIKAARAYAYKEIKKKPKNTIEICRVYKDFIAGCGYVRIIYGKAYWITNNARSILYSNGNVKTL